jgi:hypothetical protein
MCIVAVIQYISLSSAGHNHFWNNIKLYNQFLSPLIKIRFQHVAKVYLIQHSVIKFVSYLRQVSGFLRVFHSPPLTAVITPKYG